MRIVSSHWSIETAGWSVDPSDDCITLQPADYDVALQISCYHKKSGDVTDEDLLLPWQSTFSEISCEKESVECGVYSGIYGEFERDSTFWRVWSLRRGAANLFITFNCDPDLDGNHRHVVDWMLCTIDHGAA